MNKQELVKTLMKRMEDFGYFPTFTNVKTFIKEYEKLAKPEPTKPVVPQFVAEWIKRRRERREYSLLDAMHLTAQSEDFRKWIMSSKHQEVFARAWLDGYEIEKEKRYLVKMAKTEQYLHHVNGHFSFVTYVRPEEEPRLVFSKKELKEAGFGWVFDCPGIEIEEVE